MTTKLYILNLGLACTIFGCASFPELEKAAPLGDPQAEFTKFLSSEALNNIPTSLSRVAQPFKASQLDNMHRRANNLRSQNATRD
jgi:hypothetical protein